MSAWVFIAMIATICAISIHCYCLIIFIGILFYVAHGIFWADHIYYSPCSDYEFKFNAALSFGCKLTRYGLTSLAPLPTTIDTCILPVKLTANRFGYIFDPYIELRADHVVSRQYFERGVNGQRFLNLTRLLAPLQKSNELIQISCRYCNIQEGEFSLLGFSNPAYLNKRVLIVAPHADDAELAAFAFYKHADSAFIVTITAGEVDAESYEVIVGKNNKVAAGLLKGRLRAWDSVAIPMWAGAHVESIQLGYFCMTLKTMYEQPGTAISSQEMVTTDVRPFRVFNKKMLSSDQQGDNSWLHLLADLTELVSEYQPDIIVTPHPKLDAQVDHIYSTRAIFSVCENLNIHPDFFMYANHNHHTDMYPFGPEHCDLPLPPHFGNEVVADKLFSFGLSGDDQQDKICALQMMHDLNRPTHIKKRLRRFLQRIINRSAMPYGDDEYLRKAIRQQELFWVASMPELKKQLE